MGKRIKDLTSASSATSSDYIAIDSATNGTKKVAADKVGFDCSFMIAPEYDPDEECDKGFIRRNNNKLYVCNTNGSTGTWQPNNWVETNIAEILSNIHGGNYFHEYVITDRELVTSTITVNEPSA